MNALGLLGSFVGGGVLLVIGGTLLARAGDEFAERTRLGGLFVGMVVLAIATSLPELATDIAAVRAGAPDLAVGALMGSNMTNMAILALIDLIHRRTVWPAISLGHARTASVAIGLTALATLTLLTPTGLELGWVGVETVLIGAGYVMAVIWIRRARPDLGMTGTPTPVPTGWSVRRETSMTWIVLRLVAATTVVLISGPIVAATGEELAEVTGLGQTFVGVAFVAAATSAPELVAALAAVRIGAHDLAVGNLFGSNAVNMALLLPVDLAYTPGALLASVGPDQAVAGLGAILLMALAWPASSTVPRRGSPNSSQTRYSCWLPSSGRWWRWRPPEIPAGLPSPDRDG
ncbi:MAG TPA: sodium:calcium antiporter [Acidimicrobiia bacterium]|nr:sodium:calcium antiporter [Acidimicrobiia bacterium]